MRHQGLDTVRGHRERRKTIQKYLKMISYKIVLSAYIVTSNFWEILFGNIQCNKLDLKGCRSCYKKNPWSR